MTQNVVRGPVRELDLCDEAFPAALGIGKTDDDELLAVAAFDLEPAAAAPRSIRIAPPLRNDAFEPETGSLAQKSRPETDLVIAVAQDALRMRRNDLGQDGLAIFERRAGEIPALSVEHVEREEIQRVCIPTGNRVLQACK